LHEKQIILLLNQNKSLNSCPGVRIISEGITLFRADLLCCMFNSVVESFFKAAFCDGSEELSFSSVIKPFSTLTWELKIVFSNLIDLSIS